MVFFGDYFGDYGESPLDVPERTMNGTISWLGSNSWLAVLLYRDSGEAHCGRSGMANAVERNGPRLPRKSLLRRSGSGYVRQPDAQVPLCGGPRQPSARTANEFC